MVSDKVSIGDGRHITRAHAEELAKIAASGRSGIDLGKLPPNERILLLIETSRRNGR